MRRVAALAAAVALFGWALPAAAMMDNMHAGGMSADSAMQGGGDGARMGAMGPTGGMGNPGSAMGAMGGGRSSMTGGAMSGGAADSGADVMGRVRDPMTRMPMRSRLPGFAGASHLYHVGATGFFLDHPEHITLTTDQQSHLNRVRERVALERAESERRIDQAEQVLWSLTAADAPDASKVEEQVRVIERLRADARLAHVRAVGEAAQVLTPSQRAALVGTAPPSGQAPMSPAQKPNAQPAPMKPMRGM
jgi:Spy/CpxP family protein refolding chaperone